MKTIKWLVNKPDVGADIGKTRTFYDETAAEAFVKDKMAVYIDTDPAQAQEILNDTEEALKKGGITKAQREELEDAQGSGKTDEDEPEPKLPADASRSLDRKMVKK